MPEGTCPSTNIEGTYTSLGPCRTGGGIINSNCDANNGNRYQPAEYLNGSYLVVSDGVAYDCSVRAHGGYGVPRAECCRCNAADPLSATRAQMFKTGSAAYHCYYGCRLCDHAPPSHPPPSPAPSTPPQPPSPPPASPPPCVDEDTTCAALKQNGNCYVSSTNPVYTTLCRATCGQCTPESPPPSAPPPQYNDTCYFEPYVNFTYTGAALQGISSDLGFTEASHLCLQVTACHAVTENDFENNLLPQKRYVLRSEGVLQAEAGTTTLVRSRNHCQPPSPPTLPPSPMNPPSFPILRMQTRPLFLVSFIAQVQTTVEEFNVPTYAQRMRTRLGVEEVGVSIAPGSVFVTTEAGANSQEEAGVLVAEVTDMASDPALLSELYGAPATVDTSSIAVTQNPDAAMPPSAPPADRSDEDHSYIALIIILVIALPVGAFLLYLHLEQHSARSKAKPSPTRQTRTPYVRVTRDDGPLRKTGDISFNLAM